MLTFNHEGKVSGDIFGDSATLDDNEIIEFLDKAGRATKMSIIAELIYDHRENASVLTGLAKILREWMVGMAAQAMKIEEAELAATEETIVH